MIVKSVTGKILVETGHKSMRQTLEWCAREGVDLSGADLRKAKLSHASLDGLMVRDACLWGVDLTSSDIGFSDIREADLRCAMLKDTCLAESDLTGADLRGAYFSSTILDDARFDRALVSCPSFWDCDLQNMRSMEALVYSHLGEESLTPSAFPVVVKGLSRRLVLLGSHGIWGNELYKAGDWPLEAQRALFKAKALIEKTMSGCHSQSAKKPMRKIPDSFCVF